MVTLGYTAVHPPTTNAALISNLTLYRTSFSLFTICTSLVAFFFVFPVTSDKHWTHKMGKWYFSSVYIRLIVRSSTSNHSNSIYFGTTDTISLRVRSIRHFFGFFYLNSYVFRNCTLEKPFGHLIIPSFSFKVFPGIPGINVERPVANVNLSAKRGSTSWDDRLQTPRYYIYLPLLKAI